MPRHAWFGAPSTMRDHTACASGPVAVHATFGLSTLSVADGVSSRLASAVAVAANGDVHRSVLVTEKLRLTSPRCGHVAARSTSIGTTTLVIGAIGPIATVVALGKLTPAVVVVTAS